MPATAARELDTVLASRRPSSRHAVTCPPRGSAPKLERWLTDENDATLVDGRLVLTETLRSLSWARTLVEVVDV